MSPGGTHGKSAYITCCTYALIFFDLHLDLWTLKELHTITRKAIAGVPLNSLAHVIELRYAGEQKCKPLGGSQTSCFDCVDACMLSYAFAPQPESWRLFLQQCSLWGWHFATDTRCAAHLSEIPKAGRGQLAVADWTIRAAIRHPASGSCSVEFAMWGLPLNKSYSTGPESLMRVPIDCNAGPYLNVCQFEWSTPMCGFVPR